MGGPSESRPMTTHDAPPYPSRSDERLVLLAEAERIAQLGSWVWLPATGEVTWSDQLFAICGLDPTVVHPTPTLFFDTLHPDDRSRIRAGSQLGLTKGHFDPTECRIVRPDGEVRYVRMEGTVTLGPTGHPVRVVGTILDMTERRQREATMARTAHALARAEEVMGIGHDLNNVLTVLLLSAQTLREKVDGTSVELESIATAASSAAELVRRLLTFAHVADTPRAPIELRALLEGSEALLTQAARPSAEVQLELPDDGVVVLGDAHLLEQAVLNLVVNARDAMPQGGTVRVRLETEAAHALLVVADDGDGMPPEVARRALEPFFTTKPPGEGTGLGLAMVRGTVDACGGAVVIDSTPGIGTEVRLCLPRAER